MKEVLTVLHNLHPLSNELKDYLSQHLSTAAIKKGAFLLKPGQVCKHVWFIRSGLLRCYHILEDQQVSSKFMKEGDIIVSASSFFLRRESDEYIQALEDAIVSSITWSELEYIYNHFPEFNIIARMLTTKSYLLSEQRAAFLRLPKATDRYKAMMQQHPDLLMRVPSRYISSYLNISEGTISRIRAGKY